MPKKSANYRVSKRKGSRVREDRLPGLEFVSKNVQRDGALARIDKAAAVLSHPVSTSALDNAFRRYGIEAEDAFLTLASRYLHCARSNFRRDPSSRWSEVWPLWILSGTTDNCCRCSTGLSRMIRLAWNCRFGTSIFWGVDFERGQASFLPPEPWRPGWLIFSL